MSILFGNAECDICKKETRFIAELNDQKKGTRLLGHRVSGLEEAYEVECDYCNEKTIIYPVVIEGVLSAFLNSEQHHSYANGLLTVAKAGKNEGLEREKRNAQPTRKVASSPFEEHPKQPGEIILLEKEQWTIHKVYRKEWSETDMEKRLIDPMTEEYWYEASSEKGEKRWIVVLDQEEKNAYLQSEHPTLREEKEIKVDISENPKKPEVILDCEWTNNLYVEAYEYTTGVRLIVINEQNEIEMDLFRKTVEEAIKELEDYMELEVE